MDIQVDMFDVQLGAALLIQFRAGEQVVRVLADAGTSMSGYPKEHVLEKLDQVLQRKEGERPPRIDLLIGTHYDADHLNRMVPVIDAYEIGEAWLPPVANDTDPPAEDWEDLRASNLLGRQFSGEDGAERLHRYLQEKAKVLAQAGQLRGRLTGVLEPITGNFRSRVLRESILPDRYVPYDEETFNAALKSACQFLEEPIDHACRDVRLPLEHKHVLRTNNEFRSYRASSLVAPASAARSLAYIERSAAQDALTAKSLKEVVDALERRKVPTRYEYVQDGRPSYFSWRKSEGRFRQVASARKNQLTITLLGPSRSLIAKYWKRLPVGEYLQFALMKALPVEGITPANELSYSMVFRCMDQRVLVSGDTGFVDFKPIESPARDAGFYPEMIRQLAAPLQVVQVAHHGGHNKYFYHALEAAQYPQGTGTSYLLLSHEVKGKSRPSRIFSMFLARLGGKINKVRILFTSEPRADAVTDYRERASPPVPKNQNSDRGDVRLLYANKRWVVKKHAILL